MHILRNILFISILLNSCHFDNENRNKIKSFNLKELPKNTEISLSGLGFVDIEYIPLETNEYCTIQKINELKVGNEYFLLKHLDRILKFTTTGSFVTKIGIEGRGPNEFLGILDIDIDKMDGSIYLISGSQRKFYIYNDKGKLIKTLQSPLNTVNFRIVEGGILCYSMNISGTIENSYTLIDNDGTIIKKFPNKYLFKDKLQKYIIQNENLFYRFNNSLFKKEVYSDTVYVFENMNFKPYLVIDQGERVITPKVRSDFNPEYLLRNFITPLNLFEFGDYVYYEFLIYPESYSYIGSKANDFQVIFDTGYGITNDIDGGPNILPKTIYDEYTIISWIDALELKKHIASDIFRNSVPKYPEKKKELEKLAASLNETDNPVLILVRLKK